MNKRIRIIIGLTAIFFACLAFVLLSNVYRQNNVETVRATIAYHIDHLSGGLRMQGKKSFLFFVVILLFILTGCQPAMEPHPAPESPAVEINTPGEMTDSESQALLTPQSTSSPIIEEPVAEEPEKPITETTQIPVPTYG